MLFKIRITANSAIGASVHQRRRRLRVLFVKSQVFWSRSKNVSFQIHFIRSVNSSNCC